MEGPGISLLLFLCLVILLWLAPILIILSSDKTTGSEKLAWLLAVVFVSWFAWIFYWLLAPLKPRRRNGID